MDTSVIAWVVLLILGVVMMFAQVRLFSIDSTLKQILEEVQASRTQAKGSNRENPLSIR